MYYSLPKKQRYKNVGFMWIYVYKSEYNQVHSVFNNRSKTIKIISDLQYTSREYDVDKYDCASLGTIKCHSLRAYRRILRKYPELKGKTMLVNRYVDSDIYDSYESYLKFSKK